MHNSSFLTQKIKSKTEKSEVGETSKLQVQNTSGNFAHISVSAHFPHQSGNHGSNVSKQTKMKTKDFFAGGLDWIIWQLVRPRYSSSTK